MRRVAALGVLALALAACGSRHAASPPARFRVLDDAHGSYGGVGLGDPRAAIFRVFGRRPAAGMDEPWFPTGVRDAAHGPYGVTWDDTVDLTYYRYPDVAFVVHGSRVGALNVGTRGIRTRRGVAIGDPIARVAKRYAGSKCGTADENSEEYTPFPACAVRSAPGVYLWFGGDPITEIDVWEKPFDAP